MRRLTLEGVAPSEAARIALATQLTSEGRPVEPENDHTPAEGYDASALGPLGGVLDNRYPRGSFLDEVDLGLPDVDEPDPEWSTDSVRASRFEGLQARHQSPEPEAEDVRVNFSGLYRLARDSHAGAQSDSPGSSDPVTPEPAESPALESWLVDARNSLRTSSHSASDLEHGLRDILLTGHHHRLVADLDRRLDVEAGLRAILSAEQPVTDTRDLAPSSGVDADRDLDQPVGGPAGQSHDGGIFPSEDEGRAEVPDTGIGRDQVSDELPGSTVGSALDSPEDEQYQESVQGQDDEDAWAGVLRSVETSRSTPSGGRRVVAPPDGVPQSRGLARAAMALDTHETHRLLTESIRRQGVLPTWNSMIMPVLRALGERVRVSGEGIDLVHAFSEVILGVLRNTAVSVRITQNSPMVLLACADADLHSLPLHALAAALAEHEVPTRMLGSGLPPHALASSVRRTGPSVVVLFARMPGADGSDAQVFRRQRPAPTVILAGPGWRPDTLPATARTAGSLAEAVDEVLRGLHR